jgi:hypothetical protein
VLLDVVRVAEEPLACRADVVHLPVMLLKLLSRAEPLAARGTCVMLFLEMAPPFVVVVVVKVYLAFCAIDVITTLPVVRFEAVLGVEDPIVRLTIPVLGLHVLHLRLFGIKLPIAFLAVVVFRAVPIVLDKALLAPEVDVAAIA